MNDFASFTAWIIALGVIAVLSIVFEKQLITAEDKLRDYFSKKIKRSVPKK